MSDQSVPSPPEVPSLPREQTAIVPYLRRLNQYIHGEFKKRSTTGTVQGTLFLSSPNGKTWAISVDNAGVISATAVAEGGGI